jgi:mutator protein MutT
MKLQVGVKLLIKNSNGQYLLVQRNKPLADGSDWDIPGGRIEPTERVEEALSRELREEIGVDLDTKVKLFKVQDIILPDADLHVVRITYTTTFDKEINLGTEHHGFKWVGLKQAFDVNLDPYLRDVLLTL